MLNQNFIEMKKLTLNMMILIMFVSILPTTLLANSTEPTVVADNAKTVPAEIQVLLTRLDEIKTMDKSALSSADKKELRKEVRTIKSTLRSSGNGVYLSVGAIIIIILLLILLL
jgi:hypothetical protein